MRLNPLLMQLLMGMSMSRYLPAMGTAGLLRSIVSGYSRVPRPPPRIKLSTSCIRASLPRKVPPDSALNDSIVPLARHKMLFAIALCMWFDRVMVREIFFALLGGLLVLGLIVGLFVLPLIAFVRSRRIAELEERLWRMQRDIRRLERRLESA